MAVPHLPLFTTATTKDGLVEQVQMLRKDVQEIQASFMTVTHTLSNLSRYLPPRFPLELTHVRSIWAGICDEFRAIIWQSKDLAGQGRVAVADFNLFLDQIMQDTTIPSQQTQNDISRYRNDVSKNMAQSQEITNRLQNLGERVKTFGDEWREALENHKWYQFMPQYKNCKAELDRLDKDLCQLKLKIVVMHCAFVAGTAALTAGVVLSVLHGCFDANIAQGASGVVGDAWVKARNAVKKRRQEKKRRNNLRVELEQAKTMGLEDINKIATKLAAICNIWGSIVADLDQVDGFIQIVVSDEHCHPHIFQNRLQAIKQSYSQLEIVFRQYQIALI